MNTEEIKNDIKEFNNLRNQLDSLWEALEIDSKDKDKLLTGKNRKEFIKALECATDFVGGIAPYYDNLQKYELHKEECDFINNRNSKKNKK